MKPLFLAVPIFNYEFAHYPVCNDDDVTFHIYVQIAHNVLHAIYICLTLRDVELDLEGI